ncbi:hypothetical protein K6119_15015 [Paracrocinitomix mangrovi]|uniref:hypothetical protein n=1 Tax=Paracrocinitomix mangrovi TaxID=2862509 RepID=UPI001C8EAF9E|nr:hypothetical protein [Paracrocinitomix mangrovi]UKN01039.1 hypothetical protein K6119_15015 [Paracrocinitomix mangrovi]
MKKLSLIFLLLSTISFGQDSLRIMFHNLLNFPSTNASRTSYYRTVLQYAKPDVYVVNELDNETGADLILNQSLNVFGTSHYQRAQFIDGVDTDNCLYYNSDKLGLVDQMQLATSLRDISVYQMYYKAPNLTAVTDTIYMWFFSCHLKAGVNDYQQRNQEALTLKYYLNSIADHVENVFVGGDFNFYSGYESGCQSMLNSGDVPLIDPVNAIGNWSGDYNFADWHTQSTRNSSIGGGTGGGLDDRFDLIFVSEDVMNNQNGINYLSNTYKPLGQDGNHFNDAVNAGSNSSVPDSVANALYNGSDHLPIMMDIVFDETATIPVQSNDYLQAYYSNIENTINFTTSLNQFDFELYDLSGRKVMNVNADGTAVQVPNHLKGMFVWRVKSDKGILSDRIFIR